MIQLTENLAISSDGKRYIVGFLDKEYPGAAVGRNTPAKISSGKYYDTISEAVQGALEIALNHELEGGDVTTLWEFNQSWEKLQEQTKKLLALLDDETWPGKQLGKVSKLGTMKAPPRAGGGERR